MRIIVTGATGFLGQNICRQLRTEKHQVIAIGRQEKILAKLKDLGATPMILDLRFTDFDNVTFEADVMVHCAALSAPWGRYESFRQSNIIGTQTALSLARKARVKRFVHISTPSLYFTFQDQHSVLENQPLPKAVNNYALTKREAETHVVAAKDMDPIILRPRGIYGKGDTALLPRLLKAAESKVLPLMRGGKAVTDLTHVDDVISAIKAAINAPENLEQKIFNISGGQALTIKEIVEGAASKAGQDIRWRRAPVWLVMGLARLSEVLARLNPRVSEPIITAYSAGIFAYSQTLDISAAEKYLKWTPKVSFQDGLKRTFGDAL